MSKDSKILIVEDEQHINMVNRTCFVTDGYYKIRKAYDGEEALKLIKEDKPDLILMDVMIPEIDGFTLCKIIKDDDYLKSIQVIMLTAKKLEDDILNGFKTGAIDYITKPFSNKILLARINAHLENVNSDIKLYKDVVLDEKSFAVKVNNKAVELTHFEFKLIKLFISNAGKVFSRSALLQYLRGDEGFDVSERAIDVQILNLRRKLGSLGENIKTVRGFGYKLKGLNDE